MAAWACLGCGTVYSVEAPCCPHCGSTDWAEDGSEEAEMAKITKHGGPSDAVALDTELDGTGGALPPAVEGGGELVAGEAYDPGDYTVAEVSAYLDQCVDDGNLDEARRVLRAERTDQGGKGRAGILNRVI